MTFDFAMVSHFILSLGLIYAETSATSKINDIDTTTAFVLNMSDWFFEKCFDKMKHVNYNLY